ncbi:SDR family mycofactocin-dependent oxidoreductase [Pseudochelatococcus lubricantis]|uniref:SDR family mycofactocin-dependent oxidoreductase n=1 Tax=Pseudochelatococcus lubricantis TaxID=1538102 RepID=A0ABX0V551_9HYPH|nr:mycofactocin-coupled SDR family oxidoreductase [Pseudochelatococcus lubricantis]NIJ60326.1 SDR family mycofactocin-dependent oxidoreductase [Pseudochelatococcus lubricantis]
MGRIGGKVAFVTGAARGLGRATALRFAEEGADLLLVDIPATEQDLVSVCAAVEDRGQRAQHTLADVRDLTAMEQFVQQGAHEFGRLDIVVANAGIITWGRFWEMDPQRWRDMIDINLTGVFNTFRAAAPAMIGAGNGGSIIAVSSVAGIKSLPGQAHYSAAKAGVVGLVKSAAIELAPYRIRVNSVHPWGMRTAMSEDNPEMQKLFEDNPSYAAAMGQILLDPPVSEPEDVANAILFLASEEARTITAAQVPVDHGATKI